jgi:hypothetical protein
VSAPVSKNHGSRPAGQLPPTAKRPARTEGPPPLAVDVPLRVPVIDHRHQAEMVWLISSPEWADLIGAGGMRGEHPIEIRDIACTTA